MSGSRRARHFCMRLTASRILAVSRSAGKNMSGKLGAGTSGSRPCCNSIFTARSLIVFCSSWAASFQGCLSPLPQLFCFTLAFFAFDTSSIFSFSLLSSHVRSPSFAGSVYPVIPMLQDFEWAGIHASMNSMCSCS